MSLITPDFGLIFWMTLIFGVLFFVLAKFGFPMITGAVNKRAARIEESLRKAEEAEKRLESLSVEQAALIESARQEQNRILKEAMASRDEIIESAKARADDEAAKILSKARTEIQAERESALRDIRREVALLSIGVAEKVVREKLEKTADRDRLIDAYVDEATKAGTDRVE